MEENFMYANVYFFVKSCFKITKENLEIQFPKMFLFMPTGKEHAQHPLGQISEIKLDKKAYTTSLILGFILSYFAFDTFRLSLLWGWLFLIIGICTVFNAYKTFIVIKDHQGEETSYSISYFERSKAESFINEVNNTLLK
ncbi:MAG: hypothetical protein N4A62_08855 [Marinisporobacter sp.]|jgi:hypothetical protein|nr:hypothetical protein [Marinisporobacter sp.]